ncbi:NAD-dependent epimerase/dehydratase family protein [Actinomadura sp. NPDC048021]|uniref:NAD-dependent epimerase/dehydratase family protein n=1 Tax=Actinomadura sp. NPDC048021 TaxID=3155385 RepID=UPI0033F6EA9A
MAAAILVTGGTGTLGRQVVPRLREAGRDVRVLSRRRAEARRRRRVCDRRPVQGRGHRRRAGRHRDRPAPRGRQQGR